MKTPLVAIIFSVTLALSLVLILSPLTPIVLEARAISVTLLSSAYDVNPNKVIGPSGLAICVAIPGNDYDIYYNEEDISGVKLNFLVDHDDRKITQAYNFLVTVGWYGYSLDGQTNVTFTPFSQQIEYHYYPNGGRSVTEINSLILPYLNGETHTLTIYAKIRSIISPLPPGNDLGSITASSNTLTFTLGTPQTSYDYTTPIPYTYSPTPSTSPAPAYDFPPITPTPTPTPTVTANPTSTPTPTPIASPTPSPSPSPTPTQQPTFEPTQSAQPTTPPNDTALFLILGIVAAAVVAITIVGLAMYSKKFKKLAKNARYFKILNFWENHAVSVFI
jgi:hypothetical protein